MLSVWFMWIQVISCMVAAGMLIKQGSLWMAWVWFCYGLANIGFVGMASHA